MDNLNVAIIGGGPAGLTVAKLLQDAKISYHIFEREADRTAANRAGCLDLHPDGGQAALQEAGLFDKFQKLARTEGETLRIYSPEGTLLMDESRGDPGRTSEFKNRPEIDRDELRDMLLDSLDEKNITWGAKLSKLQQAAGDKKITLIFADGSEKTEFNLVVGADGAWSKVRPSITDVEPAYSGIAGLDCRISDIDANFPELSTHIGHGMCLNLGADKGMLCQRNGDGAVQLYAFARLSIDWFTLKNIDGAKPEARQQVVDTLYPEYTPRQKSLVLNSDIDTAARQLYMLPIGFQWEHNPSITLIGDASHLMTPFAGVGVNVAMKDALELGRSIIGRAEYSGLPLNGRLQKFEKDMWKRAKEKAEETIMYQNLFFHSRGGVAMVEHFDKKREQGHH